MYYRKAGYEFMRGCGKRYEDVSLEALSCDVR